MPRDARGHRFAFWAMSALPRAAPKALFTLLHGHRHAAPSRILVRVIAGVPLAVAIFAWLGYRGTDLILPTIIGVAVMLADLLFWLALFQPSTQRTVNEFLNGELCPACGYSIRELAAEPDGCTVCPECGAAWRLP
jgi:hypothetical protein